MTKLPLYPHIPKKKEVKFPHRTDKQDSEIVITRESTGYEEEDSGYPLPRGVTYPVLYKEVKAVIDHVGHVTYTYFPSVGVGYVEGISVAPSYRRQGFGTNLLQFAIDDMRKKGITKVGASAWSKEGEKILKAFGFIYAGTGTFMVKPFWR